MNKEVKDYPSYMDYPLRSSNTILTPISKDNVNKILLYHQRTTDISESKIYKRAAESQEIFMRDKIGQLIKGHVFIVGTHRSKSIELPVYGFIMRNGIKVIASYNFYMWVVSVELPKALTEGFLDTDLFMNGVKEKVDYYYGFKEEWKYGCYNPKDKNCTKFSVTLSNDYKFYTLIYILNKAFNKLTFQDNRNIQEITRSIENIYKVNGVYETELSDRWGTGNMRKRPLLHGYEVLRATCIKHGKLKNDPYNYDDVFDDASMFAETVCSDTQLKEEFLMEEFMFNTIF